MRNRLGALARLSLLAAIVLLQVLSFVSPAEAAGQTPAPVVRFYLFHSQTCPHCKEIIENYLPKVYKKYGAQLEYRYFDIYNNTDNYMTMLGVEKKLGLAEDQQGLVPALVIGDQVLMGAVEIPEKLEGLIDQYLAQGGLDWPSLENLPEVILPTPAPAVQILVFYQPQSADFATLNSLISTLGQQFGSGIQAYAADLTQAENVTKIEKIHKALGLAAPQAGTPEVLVDRQLLIGMPDIAARLPGLVETYLQKGGVDLPNIDEWTAGTTSTPVPAKPIKMAFFELAGCQECARTNYDLQVVLEQYPQLEVERFPMDTAESKALNEWLSDKFDVPVNKRLTTPMLFIGQDVLIGKEASLTRLLEVVGSYAQTGAESTWADFDPSQAKQSLVDRFRSWGVLVILVAGLIDGLNPCAFATLVFFISYMAFSGRRGRDILFVGIAFALGVFLTYLLVGVGLLRAVQSLKFFSALGKWVYLVTALLCATLAALTFRDVARARKGQASEMTLKLPMVLRRRIHKIIRESAQVRAFVAMAFVTGFVISLIELACTGQVYLPTIIFVMSVPELASKAFLYLLLYCIMFIIPLVALFLVSYFGTTSERLAAFVNRHTATVKLATGLLFVGLALWMTWALARLFGIRGGGVWILMAGVAAAIALAAFLLDRFKKAPSKKALPKKAPAKAVPPRKVPPKKRKNGR